VPQLLAGCSRAAAQPQSGACGSKHETPGICRHLNSPLFATSVRRLEKSVTGKLLCILPFSGLASSRFIRTRTLDLGGGRAHFAQQGTVTIIFNEASDFGVDLAGHGPPFHRTQPRRVLKF
jgi:hypothetical protein